MREKVHTIGKHRNLAAIITEPGNHPRNEQFPAFIMLNAGLTHHVGPFRLNVTLARMIASIGCIACRLDLSGIGDSGPSQENHSYWEQTVNDIRETMDFIGAKHGVKEFILFGACSGADNAHRTAVEDKRVIGAVFVDGYSFPTLRYYLKRYGRTVLSIRKWWNLIIRLFTKRLAVGREAKESSNLPEGIDYTEFPPKNNVRRELQALIDRRVELLYFYTGGFSEYYNYKEQFEDMFSGLDLNERVKVCFLPEADHTLILQRDKKQLLDTISQWAQARFISSHTTDHAGDREKPRED